MARTGNDHQEAAKEHDQAKGQFIERRIGAETRKGTAVGRGRGGVSVEDLGEGVGPGLAMPARPAQWRLLSKSAKGSCPERRATPAWSSFSTG